MNNKQVQNMIVNTITEVDKINSNTNWSYKGQLVWGIKDLSDNFLGLVNASICVKSGCVTFTYKHDKTTYSGVDKVNEKVIEACEFSDETAFNKLSSFDTEIIKAHNIEVQ